MKSQELVFAAARDNGSLKMYHITQTIVAENPPEKGWKIVEENIHDVKSYTIYAIFESKFKRVWEKLQSLFPEVNSLEPVFIHKDYKNQIQDYLSKGKNANAKLSFMQ